MTKLLKIGFFFKPLIVSVKGQSLAKANLHPDEELIVIERKGNYRAFLAREMRRIPCGITLLAKRLLAR